jgi:dTDP-4-amino-4,6-dideoxygalactose transaminase
VKGVDAAVRIPRIDLERQREALGPELPEAVDRVLRSGRFVLGPETEAFEAELAGYLGARHCVGVGSGTDALRLALTGLGVGPGSEVITVSHTAVPTAFAIEMAGATPVFVDVDPGTQTMDPARAAEAIGPATRAIVPVHLYGRCADVTALRDLADEHGLWLVEDVCQAHGARVGERCAGTLGHAGCFSFYPTKNLGAYGDGGAVVTDDGELAERLRRRRSHGLGDGYMHDPPAGNSRLDELQAAILRVKLPHLDDWNAARRRLAAVYGEHLDGLPLELPDDPGGGGHVFHLYVVRTQRRDELLEHLRQSGVDAAIHYPVPAHRQPPYAGSPPRFGLPVTEACSREVISLPMYPELDEGDVERVARHARELFER